MSIYEQNKMIAEFMKIPYCDRCASECEMYKFGEGVYYNPYQMRYPSSWDWLMPVIEKIAKFQFGDIHTHQDAGYPRTFGMISPEGKFMVRLNRCALFEADTLIEAAYLAVVDFITWYNANKTK